MLREFDQKLDQIFNISQRVFVSIFLCLKLDFIVVECRDIVINILDLRLSNRQSVIIFTSRLDIVIVFDQLLENIE